MSSPSSARTAEAGSGAPVLLALACVPRGGSAAVSAALAAVARAPALQDGSEPAAEAELKRAKILSPRESTEEPRHG